MIKNKNLVGICGLIGSGKGAASDYLQQKYNFQHISFADSLKHAVGAIFGWDFELLKGTTGESRQWREQTDHWWAKRLGIPNLTPRWILQQWGTEVGRRSFHQDIWIASLEHKLENTDGDFVIDDCRFHNEIEVIRARNGKLVRINRGKLPIWYDTAIQELKYLEKFGYETGFESQMSSLYPDVHVSEWGWVNETFDYEIANNGTMNDLYLALDSIVREMRK